MNLWLFEADFLSFLLTWQFPLRLGVSVDQIRPIDKINLLNYPILIIAAENDRHTTLDESRQLFAAANQPKDLWIVSGAQHEDLYKFVPKEYEKNVLEFFKKTLQR